MRRRRIGIDRKPAGPRRGGEDRPLSKGAVDPDPFRQFGRWMEEAVEAGEPQPDAAVLAAADRRGRPSARAVLLKGCGPEGFVFYTNLESRKAAELEANPYAALCVVWLGLHRQVRIEGRVEQLDGAASDDYFASRPREAQIAAAASPQSRVLRGRAELEELVDRLRAGCGEGPVPRPDSWGGLAVRPDRFEFWQGRRHRLHDRIVYAAEGEGWRIERLAP